MHYNIRYVLLSYFSQHIKYITNNNKLSFYFSIKEKHKIKLNNPRLTLNGIIKKIKLDKNTKIFLNLLNAYEKIDKGSKMWGMFIDFNFYEFKPERALFIEGFGKAYQKKYN